MKCFPVARIMNQRDNMQDATLDPALAEQLKSSQSTPTPATPEPTLGEGGGSPETAQAVDDATLDLNLDSQPASDSAGAASDATLDVPPAAELNPPGPRRDRPVDSPPPPGDGQSWGGDAGGAEATFSLAPEVQLSVRGGQGEDDAPSMQSGDQPLVPGYEIVGELGRGGMGVVYKARQKGLNRWVALKMVLAGAHADALQLARFRTEAEAIAHLQHPNIVQVYDVGEQNGLPYFSLEFVDGGSLDKKVHRQPQPPREAAHMIETLALAMAYAHKHGIIHRDLKPANILLTLSGVPKIMDFGLAKRFTEDSSQTKSGTLMGTPSYMAPEQARGEIQSVGPQADVYALGAMLYELLTGRPPFLGATPMETVVQVTVDEPMAPTRLQPAIPRDLETVCLKCLQKEMPKRYGSALELAEDLRRFLSHEPILARPVSNFERLLRWCKRNPRVAALVGVVALLLVVVAVGSTTAAIRISAAKAEAERNAAAEKRAREDADRNAELATMQAEVAAKTAYDVVTQVDEELRDKAGLGSLRFRVLDLTMKNLAQISRELIDSGKADRTMAAAIQRTGTFYEQMGQTDKAIKAYRDALQVFERLIKEVPNEERNKFNAAVCYDNLGEIYREVEPDPTVLFSFYQKSLELREPLVGEYHNQGITLAERHRLVGVSHVKLGNLCQTVGDPATALAHGGKALDENQAAATLDPADRHNMWTYTSDAYYLLGRASAHAGAIADARRHLEECRKLRAAQVEAEPLNALAKQFLAATDDALGDLALEQGELKSALEHYQRAHDGFDWLCQKGRSNPEFQWYRSGAAYHLGIAHQCLGHSAPAHKAFEACLEARRALCKDDPKNPMRKLELMLVLARLGQHGEASARAHEVQEYAPRHPGMLFAAACGYALCIPAVNDPRLRTQYTDKAAGALRQALAAGYRDAGALEHDPNLEPLRATSLYKSLLTQVARN